MPSWCPGRDTSVLMPHKPVFFWGIIRLFLCHRLLSNPEQLLFIFYLFLWQIKLSLWFWKIFPFFSSHWHWLRRRFLPTDFEFRPFFSFFQMDLSKSATYVRFDERGHKCKYQLHIISFSQIHYISCSFPSLRFLCIISLFACNPLVRCSLQVFFLIIPTPTFFSKWILLCETRWKNPVGQPAIDILFSTLQRFLLLMMYLALFGVCPSTHLTPGSVKMYVEGDFFLVGVSEESLQTTLGIEGSLLFSPLMA